MNAPDWIVALYAADQTLLVSGRFSITDIPPGTVGPIVLGEVIRAAHDVRRLMKSCEDVQIQITTDERPHRIVYVWRDGEVLIDERRGDPTPNAPDSPGPWPIHSKDGRTYV